MKESGIKSNNKYRIAICDDEISTCEELERQVENIFFSLGLAANFDIFYSGESLIKALENKSIYDFVLLDIELYELNGVGVGEYIRNTASDMRTQIIFISSKTLYAMELFSITPLDFLVKPIDNDRLRSAVKRGLSILSTSEEIFEFTNVKSLVRIPVSEIMYFESIGRKIRLVTRVDEMQFYGKLSDVSEKLSSGFVRIHKSYLVNSGAVREYHSDHVVLYEMSNLPVSRKYRDEVRDYMMKRLGI